MTWHTTERRVSLRLLRLLRPQTNWQYAIAADQGLVRVAEIDSFTFASKGRRFAYRAAALCSDVWQNRKRTSLRDLAKAYLPDMACVVGVKSASLSLPIWRDPELGDVRNRTWCFLVYHHRRRCDWLKLPWRWHPNSADLRAGSLMGPGSVTGKPVRGNVETAGGGSLTRTTSPPWLFLIAFL